MMFPAYYFPVRFSMPASVLGHVAYYAPCAVILALEYNRFNIK